MPEHVRITRNRREFLTDACCGFGGLAFASMLQREDARAATLNPLAPKAPAHARKAKAKSVIFLFMAGGPSHIDTFDPKPLLNKLDGQKRPGRVRRGQVSVRQERRASCWAPSARSSKYGKSGIEVSDLLPHLGAVRRRYRR